MARNEDEDGDGLPPIGEGTIDALDQAKKGKARNFLLICKGPQVKYLIVKKKPIKKAEISDAKKLGYKGEAYIGVITGSGTQLVFNLAISDGYDSEPCSDKKLKDFLADHAELKCQPSFAILATPPSIPFDEDELQNPLIARFVKLSDAAAKVGAKFPNASAEFDASILQIKGLLQEGEFAAAEPLIGRFEQRIKEVLQGGQSNPSPSPSPTPSPSTESSTPPSSNNPLVDQLTAAMNKLSPLIKQAVVSHPSRKAEIVKLVTDYQTQFKSGSTDDLNAAKATLVELSKLIKSLGLSTTTGGPPSSESSGSTPNSPEPSVTNETDNAAADEYQGLLDGIVDRYVQVLRGQPSNASQLRVVMDFANGKAEKKDYQAAKETLKRLVGMLDEAEAEVLAATMDAQVSDEDQGRGVVAFRKALLRWDAARKAAINAIDGLKAEVVKNRPDANVGRLDKVFEAIDTSLHDALIDCINAEDKEDRAEYNAIALQKIDEFKTKIDTNDLIRGVDNNPFREGLKLKDTLKSALNEVAGFLR